MTGTNFQRKRSEHGASLILLVSIIGLADVVKAAQDAGRSTFNLFFFLVIAALIYLAITTLSNFALIWLERRYSVGVRHAQL